jgi:hypothetical protein
MTRATVPVGEDIGFLPGTEEEKMAPWMGALEDNLDVLTHTDEKDSRPLRRRMGQGGNARHHPLADQGQVDELHARSHFPEEVPDHR